MVREDKAGFRENRRQAQVLAHARLMSYTYHSSSELLNYRGQFGGNSRLPQNAKILFLAANPKDAVKLRLDEECREIENRISLAQKRDRLILVNKGAVRVGDLQLHLNQEKPDIVHFSSHGTEQGRIILEDERGYSRPISPEALTRVFKILRDNIRCVILNACFSMEQSRAISKHIECVVGMSHEIRDTTAIAFSSAFYLAIASGRSVKNAFDQGINEIMLAEIPEEHIPKLLVRNHADPSTVFLLEAGVDQGKPTSSTGMSAFKREVTYCRRCGELAGKQSTCTGLFTHHDFTTGSGRIYCRWCGVEVGKRSTCTGLRIHHEFVSASS